MTDIKTLQFNGSTLNCETIAHINENPEFTKGLIVSNKDNNHLRKLDVKDYNFNKQTDLNSDTDINQVISFLDVNNNYIGRLGTGIVNGKIYNNLRVSGLDTDDTAGSVGVMIDITNGRVTGIAPRTPSDAQNNEIVTASFVNDNCMKTKVVKDLSEATERNVLYIVTD